MASALFGVQGVQVVEVDVEADGALTVWLAEQFGGLVTDASLDFRTLHGFDPREAASNAAGEAASRPGVRGAMSLFRAAVDGLRAQVPSMRTAVTDADVVLCCRSQSRHARHVQLFPSVAALPERVPPLHWLRNGQP